MRPESFLNFGVIQLIHLHCLAVSCAESVLCYRTLPLICTSSPCAIINQRGASEAADSAGGVADSAGGAADSAGGAADSAGGAADSARGAADSAGGAPDSTKRGARKDGINSIKPK
jgi:hypothetical protein